VPSRRKTREFVLQVLFAADAQGKDPEEVLILLEGHFASNGEESLQLQRVMQDFARQLVAAVAKERELIDEVIRRLSLHWKLYRMSRVDRNILRMAIAEMTHFPDIPGRVTLNEAIDLGKKYGAENSATFINGILDRIHALRSAPDPAQNINEILARLDESNPTG
jgi:N utilization substance protein B